MMILATSYALPYKVMRCALATGVRPIVVGVAGSPKDPTRFRRSRLCDYVELPVLLTDPEAVPRLRAIVGEHAVAKVLPGDIDATRFLIANAAHFEGLYPLPDLATFDRLNDKWGFAELCRAHDVRHPRTWLLEDASEIKRVAEETEAELIAKPPFGEGGLGVTRVDATNWDQLTYEPVLLQEFVEGADRCITLLCRHGVPRVSVVHHYESGAFVSCRDDELFALASTLVVELGFHGVINFDVRETPEGELYLIEANPRFWDNIDKTLIAGDCNFVELGFAPSTGEDGVVHVRPAVVRTLPAIVRGLLKGQGLSATDVRYLRFVFSETPLDVVREGLQRQLTKLRRSSIGRRATELAWSGGAPAR